MKAVTMYKDLDGKVHETAEACVVADARHVFYKMVEKHTCHREFIAEDFLDELRTNGGLRDALEILIEVKNA